MMKLSCAAPVLAFVLVTCCAINVVTALKNVEEPDSAAVPGDMEVALPAATSQAVLRRFTRRRTPAQALATAFQVVTNIDYILWNPAQLLCKKPAIWPNPRTIKDATWSIRTNPTTNVTYVNIRHAPIAGVTVKQLIWLQNNKDKLVRDPRTQKSWQAHVLHHPLDNQFFRYNNPPGAKTLVYNAATPKVGTAWHFGHFYSAGCTPSKTASGPTITCPASRVVPTCRTPYATVISMTSYNHTQYYALYNNATGFAGMIDYGGFTAFKEAWAWRDVKLSTGGSGVALEESAVFGINEAWAAGLNTYSATNVLARATGNDVQLYFAQWLLHEIQSFGWLPNWLPSVSTGTTTDWGGSLP